MKYVKEKNMKNNKTQKIFDIIFGIITALIVIFYLYFQIDIYSDRMALPEGETNLYPLASLLVIIYFLIPLAIDLLIYIIKSIIMAKKRAYRFPIFFTITLAIYVILIIAGFLMLPLLGN